MTPELEAMLPPHSIEAEQSVIGGILLEGDKALDRIEGILAEDDFYRQEHRLIFTAVRALANTGRPIDIITVAEALEGSGSLERIGGLPYPRQHRAQRPQCGKYQTLCGNRERARLAAPFAGNGSRNHGAEYRTWR